MVCQIGDANARCVDLALKYASAVADDIHGHAAKDQLRGNVFDAWPIRHIANHAVVGIGDEFEHAALVVDKRKVVQIALELERAALGFPGE